LNKKACLERDLGFKINRIRKNIKIFIYHESVELFTVSYVYSHIFFILFTKFRQFFSSFVATKTLIEKTFYFIKYFIFYKN